MRRQFTEGGILQQSLGYKSWSHGDPLLKVAKCLGQVMPLGRAQTQDVMFAGIINGLIWLGIWSKYAKTIW